MKKIIATALCVVALAATASAQSIYFENLYGDYKDNEDAVTMSITGNLIALASFFADEVEDKDMLAELGKSIDMVKMVMLEGDMVLNDRDLAEFKRMITTNEGFEELMVMRDGGATVDVLAIESGGVMKEVILVMREDSEMVVMDLWGDIDLKNLDTLIEAVDME